LFSEDATAQASLMANQFTVADAQKTTQDGQVSDVLAKVSGSWEYKLPYSKSPSLWQVVLGVAKPDSNWVQLNVAQGQAKYAEANGDFSVQGSLFDTELFAPEDFQAQEAGETTDTTVKCRVVFSVFNDSETVLASADLKDKGTTSVTNKAYSPKDHGATQAEGELIIKA